MFFGKTLLALSITAALSACGGGGGDSVQSDMPKFDYSKLNATYTCQSVATKSVERFEVTFTETNAHVVSITFPGEAKNINDVIGMGNGYPMYSEYVPNTTDALSFVFTTDGYLTFGTGPRARISEQYVNVLSVYMCKRPGQV